MGWTLWTCCLHRQCGLCRRTS
ncbi:unnamed protein product, partial [Vitis vinifera]